jgi:hypothetical protein
LSTGFYGRIQAGPAKKAKKTVAGINVLDYITTGVNLHGQIQFSQVQWVA